MKYSHTVSDGKKKRMICFLFIMTVLMFVTSCSMQEVTLVDITMEGGSGKARITSPVAITGSGDKILAKLVWTSSNYDYLLVDGVRYDNENPGGPSTFTVPVKNLEEPLKIIGDTTAMSRPHEIEYTIIWKKEAAGGQTGKAPEDMPAGGASSDKEDERIFGKGPADARRVDIPHLEWTGEIPLKYAKGLKIDLYGDYTLINIYGVGLYLIIPEGGRVPEGLPSDITVLRQPFERTYLVSTSAMDLVRQCGALDNVKFSPLTEDDWYVKDAADRMKAGDMIYAGKYRMPDYELLVGQGCDLAVENTMIYHDPEVIEKLAELGIPVIVETSSYETEPLGRLEWIKLYGLIYKRAQEAEAFFDAEAAKIEAAGAKKTSGKRAAFFSVSSTGMINVRKNGDYMVKLLELAGLDYVPADTGTDTKGNTASMNMQMEDFYSQAADADVIIYNSTIEDEVASLSSLTDMNPLFAQFKAVKEKNVYCLGSGFFQNPTKMSVLVEDLEKIQAGDTEDLTYLYHPE